MKKIILILVLFSIIGQVKSQIVQDTLPWCPPGATWLYKMVTATESLYLQYSYEKDTLILNKNAKKLNVSFIRIIGPGGTQTARYIEKAGVEFFYNSNDSVFLLDKPISNFKFIYSFNPQLNDEFVIGNSRQICQSDSTYPKTDTIKVSKILKDTFENVIFDVYYTSWDRKFFIGTIVKNIGSIRCPFPQINYQICKGNENGGGSIYDRLICYSDSLRGTHTFNYRDDDKECHFAKTAVNNFTKKERNLNVKLYPNPAVNKLNILTETPVKEIYIYDLFGKLIKQVIIENTKTNGTEITIDELNTGIYFIHVIDAFDAKLNSKFIKE